ncbi:acyl-CoA dehydrogenase family protein [Paraburkholderia oxyphila]|uniref:acyl-CoA dehydrogenase family protein n=1 Tax=Paraburkholderia oxyphila TaxID=614212 RepID=UPI000482C460|nr:acyl-CoA dehydrogenase family protein [Paraburkholderia oxyphila]
MDFQPDAGLTAFREEVRAFLRAHLPADLAGSQHRVRSPRAALIRWQGILNEHGWGAPCWETAHGGTGWTPQQRLVFDEECAAAGAPTQDVFGQRLLGPVLNHFASPEQKAEHLPHIFAGTRLWCQGFSEPGSGSDLASLRTQAVRDGDHYVVNGQKIWTSYAHEADWIFLLVRTDASVKKQAGISFLLVDMQTPGITVRPIITIDGCHHLNETFFDNVRVPVANCVGGEGAGWTVTKFLLNNEHAGTADLPALLRLKKQLRTVGATLRVDGQPLVRQAAFALRLARLEAELQAVSMMVQRVAVLEQDHSPTAHVMGSMLKIRGTELQQKMSEFLVESLGDYGAIAYTAEPHAEQGDALPVPAAGIGPGLASEMFFRRASTIYGGTSEVQRGIIAKLLFQL